MSPEEIERNHIESSMSFEDEQRSALGYSDYDQYEARIFWIYKSIALALVIISSAITGVCMVVGAHWMGWL